MQKLLMLVCLMVGASAMAQLPQGDLKIKPEMLKLTYQPDDGDSEPCTAKFLYDDNPYDFKVTCRNEKGIESRTLSVHLALTFYNREVKPQMQMEILYWVNGEGATTWLTFKDASAMTKYEASQSIKGEPASLRLELNIGQPTP